jgi:hypothetical protein
MEMKREQSEKLKRYLFNANPFLWDVLAGKNKKSRIKELKKLGFLGNYSEGSNPPYSKIIDDLLIELGIEGILEQIVIKNITARFTTEVLSYFRRCWEQGQIPDKKYLKEHHLYGSGFLEPEFREGWGKSAVTGYRYPAYIFVQIHRQHDFVERWTVFAGLWFEDIEPVFGASPKT